MHYTQPDVYEFISRQTSDPIVERKTCRVSGTKFAVYQSDVEFCKKMSPIFQGHTYKLPIPDLCPEERFRRRLAFRHEIQLYARTCDASGRKIISAYSTDKPYTVYSHDVYWSDQWDPLDYGRIYEEENSFFDQFRRLQLLTPRLNLLVDERNINSLYVNQANLIKDCYLVWGSVESEGCLYGYRTLQCNHTCDTSFVSTSEYCYQCVDVDACYDCNYCHQSDNCQHSRFLYNCRSCKHCVLCTNLSNKQYCILNQQYTKQEYEEKLRALQLHDYEHIQRVYQQFIELKTRTLHRALHVTNVQDCYGSMLSRTKDCIFSYVSRDCTRCDYCHMVSKMQDCRHLCYGWGDAQLVYEGVTVGDGTYKSGFCIDSRNIQDCYYCDTCINSKHCFGCIGLNGKEYCVLNQQYTKQQYEQLVSRMIAEMQSGGERGYFFPMQYSPLAYNETPAQLYCPMTEEEVQEKGLEWKQITHTIDVPVGMQGVQAVDLPCCIEDVDDTILQKAIVCEETHRPFRVIAKELAFYKKKGLPLPRTHPDVRNLKRISQKEPWELYVRRCDKTSEEMLSVYPKDVPFHVYSQKSYEKEVYG